MGKFDQVVCKIEIGRDEYVAVGVMYTRIGDVYVSAVVKRGKVDQFQFHRGIPEAVRRMARLFTSQVGSRY